MPLTIPAAAGQNTRRLDIMLRIKTWQFFTMMSLVLMSKEVFVPFD